MNEDVKVVMEAIQDVWPCEIPMKKGVLRKVERLIGGALARTDDVVSTYDYKDVRGRLLYRVTREEWRDSDGCRRKRFTERHPGGDGRMEYGYGGEAVPYRLPEVVDAASGHRPIIIVDGEKDAEALRRVLGGCVTCAPGGLGQWMGCYTKYLMGCSRVVIVIPAADGRRAYFARDARHGMRRGGFRGAIEIRKLPGDALGVHEFVREVGDAAARGSLRELCGLSPEA